MQDFLARAFIIFVLVMYAAISLVFVVGAIRKWIWRPIFGKLSARRPEKKFQRIKSASREESSS